MGTETRTEPITYNDSKPKEAYGYKDTSSENETTLVLTYDGLKSTRTDTYDIPTNATQASE